MTWIDLVIQGTIALFVIQGLKSIFDLQDRQAKIATVCVGTFVFVLDALLPTLAAELQPLKVLGAFTFRALLIFVPPGAYSFGKALFNWLKNKSARGVTR